VVLNDNVNPPGISCVSGSPGATALADNATTVCNPGLITVNPLPPPPGQIPTLSQWAMLLLVSLVVGSGFLLLRRRRVM
jgi:hypothetical protein